MFTRDTKPSRIDTLIGKAAHVHGDIEFAGGLHLDGSIVGNVRSDRAPASSLSISESATIVGTVDVPNVRLDGSVKGDIRAPGRVVLGATARVEGNLSYGVIEMTLGAQIMGKLTQLFPGGAPEGSASGGASGD
ncbi:MAG TPA: polymer-forming cytoskeletal protein [Steroidobacteraceae bacterium]